MPVPPTFADSILKLRFEQMMREAMSLYSALNRSPCQESRFDQLEREIEDVRVAWKILIARKKTGELTDSTRIIAARKIISECAACNSLPVKISEQEHVQPNGDTDQKISSRYWLIRAVYAGDESAISEKTWTRFFRETTASLQINDLCTRSLFKLLRWQDSDKKLTLPPMACWEIDAQVWDGPLM
jgi:hypothetical protein